MAQDNVVSNTDTLGFKAKLKANASRATNKQHQAMKRPEHIMKAIDLLQANKVKSCLPWWLIPLDYLLTLVYLTAFGAACIFIIYNVLLWL